MTSLLTCAVCGHRFDPDGRDHCRGCPLVRGCQTVCCPACGHVDVDPHRTTIGRWLAGRGDRRQRRLEKATRLQAPMTLADVPAGYQARIAAIEGAPDSRRQQLRAYGVLSGDWVRVVQHTPVTVAVVERTELALEGDLARCIVVDGLRPPEGVHPAQLSRRQRHRA
ncbi:MAG TPA: ferrous iron transport protein A [Anaerolineales bacterium]|nr:ferrous iron transport protein A [Anaerolineales bacterium]